LGRPLGRTIFLFAFDAQHVSLFDNAGGLFFLIFCYLGHFQGLKMSAQSFASVIKHVGRYKVWPFCFLQIFGPPRLVEPVFMIALDPE
jgi:hypothetical protein